MNPDAAAHAAVSLSPIALFLQADLVVKSVMIGLILASVWTWGIIIAHSWRLRRLGAADERFERDFRKVEEIDNHFTKHRSSELPSATQSSGRAAGSTPTTRLIQPTRALEPGSASSISSMAGSHADLLKTMEEMLGLEVLNQGQLPKAISLRESAHI